MNKVSEMDAITLESFIAKFGKRFPAFADNLRELESQKLSDIREWYRDRLSGYLLCMMDMEYLQPDEYLALCDQLSGLARREEVRNDAVVEQVSVSAASSGLRLFCVLCVKNGHKSMQAVRCAFSRVSSGWAPLPGKRSLVGRESQMCLPSFKQSPP